MFETFIWVICAAIGAALATLYWVRSGKSAEDHNRDMAYAHLAIGDANDGVIVSDMRGHIQWMNPAYAKLMGRPAEEMIGRNPLSFGLPPEDTPDAMFLENFRFVPEDYDHDGLKLFRNMRGDGTIFWVEINVSFHTTAEGEDLALLFCRDVTASVEKEQKLAEANARLAYTAAHDALTGVVNRGEMIRFVTEALATGDAVGMMHIDLDNFKEINDTYGHAAGDQVLKTVADRLQQCAHNDDLVARIGGDEFVFVSKEVTSLDYFSQIGETILADVAKPILWKGVSLTCSLSLGACLSHEGCCTAEDMLSQSDFALYDAKRSGRGRLSMYNSDLHDRHGFEIGLRSDLEEATRSDALAFHFQPIMGCVDHDIRCFETLVRWDHPTHGLLSPADFLPIASENGLMARVDFQAMEAALDLKRALNHAGHADVRVSFNASSDILSHPEFFFRLRHGLREREIEPGGIAVEILESVVFQDQPGHHDFTAIIGWLSDLGVVVVLDDFGRGHAGLALLPRLAIAGLKFDMSLIRNLLTDKTVETVLRALINLCHDLNLRATVEGIETEVVAQKVAKLGADTIQGFLVGRPMAASDVVDWVAEVQKPTPAANRTA